MSGKSDREAERLEREIEAALDPGRYVSDGAAFSFVGDLEEATLSARECYGAAGLAEDWQRLVDQVRAQHHRKYSFMPGFDEVVAGSGPSQQPTFLEQAKARWAAPHQDHG